MKNKQRRYQGKADVYSRRKEILELLGNGHTVTSIHDKLADDISIGLRGFAFHVKKLREKSAEGNNPQKTERRKPEQTPTGTEPIITEQKTKTKKFMHSSTPDIDKLI